MAFGASTFFQISENYTRCQTAPSENYTRCQTAPSPAGHINTWYGGMLQEASDRGDHDKKSGQSAPEQKLTTSHSANRDLQAHGPCMRKLLRTATQSLCVARPLGRAGRIHRSFLEFPFPLSRRAFLPRYPQSWLLLQSFLCGETIRFVKGGGSTSSQIFCGKTIRFANGGGSACPYPPPPFV